LFSLVVGDGRDRVYESVPAPGHGFLKQIPAFPHPRIGELLFNGQTQLPDNFEPSIAMVKAPAHAGLRHRRPIILIKNRETLQQTVRQFVVHLAGRRQGSRRAEAQRGRQCGLLSVYAAEGVFVSPSELQHRNGAGNRCRLLSSLI